MNSSCTRPNPAFRVRHRRQKSVEASNHFLVIAAGLVVAGLIYLATRPSKLPPPQPAPIAAVTPSPPAIATPTVEKNAPLTPQAAAQPTAQPTAPVAVAIPSPSISATPIPTPSAAELLSEAQRYLDAKDFAKALPLLQGRWRRQHGRHERFGLAVAGRPGRRPGLRQGARFSRGGV
jgi:hypothetical protein